MAIASIQSATSQASSQLQRQMARRAADQLESQARSLAIQAASARRRADEAVQQADSLQVSAKSARSAANGVRQSLAGDEGARQTSQAINERVVQAGEAYRAMHSSGEQPAGAASLYGRDGRAMESPHPAYTPGSFVKLSG